MSKGQGVIIETNFTKEDQVENMVSWCKEHVRSTWSYAKLQEYNYIITFRFFDNSIAEQFKNHFSL